MTATLKLMPHVQMADFLFGFSTWPIPNGKNLSLCFTQFSFRSENPSRLSSSVKEQGLSCQEPDSPSVQQDTITMMVIRLYVPKYFKTFYHLSGPQHGITPSGSRIISVGSAVRRAARVTAHRECVSRPRRAHRRARLRSIHREVSTGFRAQILPIKHFFPKVFNPLQHVRLLAAFYVPKRSFLVLAI